MGVSDLSAFIWVLCCRTEFKWEVHVPEEMRNSLGAFLAHFTGLVREAEGTGFAFTLGVACSGAFCNHDLICKRRKRSKKVREGWMKKSEQVGEKQSTEWFCQQTVQMHGTHMNSGSIQI